MLQENHIVGKSICRKNLSQKILLQENHIPGNTSSLASSFFVLFLQSDRRSSWAKDHHCGRGSEATGGRGGRKVTHAWKKRSDPRASREKDHHCGRGSEATGGCRRGKVTHAWKKRSDRRASGAKDHHCGGGKKVTHARKKRSDRAVLRAGDHSYRRNSCVQNVSGWMYWV